MTRYLASTYSCMTLSENNRDGHHVPPLLVIMTVDIKDPKKRKYIAVSQGRSLTYERILYEIIDHG